MKTVREKLRSNDGASLALALLFFVICAAVGSVIITAASTGAGRMKNITSGDQNRYNVRSAAELLRTELTQGSYKKVFRVQSDTLAAAESSDPGNQGQDTLADVRDQIADSVLEEDTVKTYLLSLLPGGGQATGEHGVSIGSILPGNQFRPQTFSAAELKKHRRIMTFSDGSPVSEDEDSSDIGPVQAEITMQSDLTMTVKVTSGKDVDWYKEDQSFVDQTYTLVPSVSVSYGTVKTGQGPDDREDQITVTISKWSSSQ